MATNKGTSTRIYITDGENEIDLQPTPLSDFVKSEAFISAVVTNMMEQATVPPCHPSRAAIMEIWETVRYRCVDVHYHPAVEPIPVADDNVFAPRPAYVPVKDC